MMYRKLFVAAAAGAVALSAGVAMAQGDAEAGQKAFNKCRACHKVDDGGGHGVGPNLHGVFGREAGGAEGFNYSKAMADSTVVWDDETMSGYLEDPRKFMPGNKMAFPGLRNEEERMNVIAYLREATQ